MKTQKQAIKTINYYGNLARRAHESNMDFVPDTTARQDIAEAKRKLEESKLSASELVSRTAYLYLYSEV